MQVRGAEMRYGAQLKKVAEQVGMIIKGFPPGDPTAVPTIQQALANYADLLRGWATSTAGSMLADIAHRDERAWRARANEMSRNLRDEILNAPTGETLKQLLAEQVHLIQSIPLEAAQRVHKLTMEGLENSTRAKDIAAEIMRSGEVTKSRAMLIARTEVSRAATTLTQARALYIGSPGYWWTTAGDSDVRPSHKAMNGKFVQWDEPPTLDGLTGHAGCVPNCRCFARVAIPD